MREFVFVLVVSVLLVPFAASGGESGADDAKYKVTPTEDKSAPFGVFIPANAEEAFAELDKMLSPELKKEMKEGPKKDMIKHHFGLGMWMRNNWGLWKKEGSPLAKYFIELGFKHPDNMSGCLLDNYWKHLHRRKFDLAKALKCDADEMREYEKMEAGKITFEQYVNFECD